MAEPKPREIREYLTAEGRSPFADWLTSLEDAKARARVRVRLDRLALGNPGDSRSVDEGVRELRVDYGPGYRVYFGQDGNVVVILLCGGVKRTQGRDILLAKKYWQDYRRRKNG